MLFFLNSHLESESVDFLIDTGAATNVLSYDAYSLLSDQCRPKLDKASEELRAADRGFLKIYGQTVIKLSLSGRVFKVPAIVADLRNLPGILGMSFLRDENCIIDLKHDVLQIGDIELIMRKHILVYF